MFRKRVGRSWGGREGSQSSPALTTRIKRGNPDDVYSREVLSSCTQFYSSLTVCAICLALPLSATVWEGVSASSRDRELLVFPPLSSAFLASSPAWKGL